jgi:hypothetical protein
MRTRRETLHILKSAREVTGKECFVRHVVRRRGDREMTVWKIFTSEADHRAHLTTRRHKR